MRRKLEAAQPRVDRANDMVSYKVMMKEKEREYIEKTLFDRPIFDNCSLKEDGDVD